MSKVQRLKVAGSLHVHLGKVLTVGLSRCVFTASTLSLMVSTLHPEEAEERESFQEKKSPRKSP